MTADDLQRYFGETQWLPGHTHLTGKLREAFTLLADNILDLSPEGWERDQALARLRESFFWAMQAVQTQGVQAYRESGLAMLAEAAEDSEAVALQKRLPELDRAPRTRKRR